METRAYVSPLEMSSTWFHALSLRERLVTLRGSLPASQSEAELKLASQRLSSWRTETGIKGAEPLVDPLDLYRCSEVELVQILAESTDKLRARTEPPQWLRELADAFDRPSDPSDREWLRSFNSGPGVEFLVALELPISAAKRRVCERVEDLVNECPDAPFDSSLAPNILFEHLVPRLARLLIRPLVVNLHAARITGHLDGATSRERYESFVSSIGHRGESLALLEEYPVLARLAMEALAEWEEITFEFLTRLAKDWPILSTTLGLAHDDRLVKVHVHGDRHRGGRSVMVAQFESGGKLVYKPRSVAVEVHFQQLLRWLNRVTRSLPGFREVTVIERGCYGWSEFVSVRACSTHDELCRFYRRQGGYLALLYVLAASDFHFENVLACSEHPVLVDLECLFQPVVKGELEMLYGAERVAVEAARQSVLAVGLLPRPDLVGRSDVSDLSGLGAAPGDVMPMRLPDWEDAGTDEMHQVLRHLEIEATQHRPSDELSGVVLSDFVDDIVEGFSDTYRALRIHRALLLTDDGPVMRFASDTTRFIVRPTLDYGVLLDSALHPHFLRDGLERDRRLDRLVGASNWGAEVEAAEHRDLWRCDIPLFNTRPGSVHIWESSGVQIDDFFRESGSDVVKRRLRRLSEEDLARQSWIMRVSIASSRVPAGGLEYSTPAARRGCSKVVDRNRLLATAEMIGARLGELAIQADGEVTWIGVSSTRGTSWQVAPIGVDLYNGLAGVCLFLAYLGSVADEPRYTSLAKAAYPSLRRQMMRDLPRLSCGGFDGIGGLIYAFSHLGVLWREQQVLDDAAMLIDSVPAQLNAQPAADIISGAAGCIAAVLSASKTVQSASHETALSHCGRYLLDSAITMDTGIAWPAPQPNWKPLGGFAHGAAGIGWALLELAAATQELRYSTAARAAMAYQRTLFVPEAQNWRDLRILAETPDTTDEPRYMGHWCHGAAGIALAWLACSQHLHEAWIRDEAEIAVRTTRETGFGFNHSLCHGDLGNAEALLKAAEFGIATSMEEVGVLGAEVVASIEEAGCITGYPFGIEAPGLMMGLSGIGFGLMRLAAPEAVPSILLLEPPPATVMVH